MKIKLSFAFIFFLIAHLMYAQPTSDKTEGCAPLTVAFTAPVGSTTWYWDFKDGAFGADATPSNTFIAPGNYLVEFKATPTGAIVGTILIKVFSKPTFQFTASPIKGCTPLNVTFNATGTAPLGVTINSYTWVYGDGAGGSGNSVSHTYSEGVYDLSLKINTSVATCDTTKIFPKYISASTPPVAAFVTTPNPANACQAPFTVNFFNRSTSALPLKYEWNMPPVDTNRTPPSRTYSSDGTYSVSLMVTDTNNCSHTTSQSITIGKPKSSFTMPDTVCMNAPFSMVNTSSLGVIGNYLWTFDAGASIASSGAFQPFIAYSTPGTHTVTLRSTSPSGLCFHDTTMIIFVENPTVTFSGVYFCFEPTTYTFTPVTTSNVKTWTWFFGDGETSNVQNPIHTFSVPDSAYSKRGETIYKVTLSITTNSGCITELTCKVVIHLVWARFQPDTAQGCAPLTVTFYDSSRTNAYAPIPANEYLTNWDWDYGDGSPINYRTDKLPHPHTYTSPGKYNVVLIATNNKGCKDTSYAIMISVGSQKAIDFTADKLSVCPGEAVKFTHSTTDTAGITGWNYQSNGEFLSHCFQDDNPSLVFNDSTGLQDITLTADYNGCLTTVTKTNYITVKGPIAHFDYLTTCGADTVQFTDKSSDVTSLSWDFGDATTATTTGVFTHTYSASGDYQVILTAVNGGSGCAASKDTAIIHFKKIKAQFTTDTTLCINVPYVFDASASTDVYGNCYGGYSWIFSDTNRRPITSSLPTSLITFNLAGEQSIGLVVRNINGCVDTLIQHIKVYQTPALYTISDAVICIPDTLQFTDISIADTVITKWNWTFGDGGTSTLQHPTHIYSTVSGATVATTLTLTDTLGCISTSTQNISIYKPASTISILPVAPNICLGTPITFDATDFRSQGSILTYKWDFKEGGALVSGNNKTHTFASAGTYIVKMFYTEIATGCNDSTTQTVTVQNYPHAGYSTDVDGLPVLCNPQNIVFTDTSKVGMYSMPLSQAWNINSGTNTVGGATPTLTFTKGTHTVKLTVTTTNGCADDTTKSFIVVGPTGNFDMDKNNICRGDTIKFTIKDTTDVGSYTWDFGDGLTTNNVSPIHHQYNFIPPSGQTVAKLIVYGQGGVCPVSVPKNVFIHYVKADFMRNTAVCVGNTVKLTNTSTLNDVNFWTFGDGTSYAASANPPDHLYDTVGIYSITLAVKSNQYGCTDTITKKVIVDSLPRVTAIGDSVCLDATAQLLVTNRNNAYTYSWLPSAGLNNAAIYNPSLVGTATVDYYVTATDISTGCINKDTATVFIVQPLVCNSFVGGDTSIVLGQFVNLPVDNQNGLVLFTWTPPTGLSCLTCSNPQVQPLEDITYSVLMADMVGCFTATCDFKIHIFPDTFVKLPTTFTPNGDGVNDIIYTDSWGVKELISYEIYNRWGELVFKTTDIKEGWDGHYKGMLQNSDVYVYKVTALTFRDKEIFKEGHINLMR